MKTASFMIASSKGTETGYVVLFTNYGDREELTIDDLRWYDEEEEEEDGYSIESSDEISRRRAARQIQ